MDDVRRCLEGDSNVRLAELQAQPVVHDVVHHPQRRLGDASREFAQFDSVELIHIHDRQVSGEHVQLPVRVDFRQNLDLQLP